jgi:hypothetical protein
MPITAISAAIRQLVEVLNTAEEATAIFTRLGEACYEFQWLEYRRDGMPYGETEEGMQSWWNEIISLDEPPLT